MSKSLGKIAKVAVPVALGAGGLYAAGALGSAATAATAGASGSGILSTIGSGVQIAGAASSILGSITSAQGQRQQAEDSAAAAERNAANSRLSAEFDVQSLKETTKYNAAVKRQNAEIYRKAGQDALQRGGDAVGESELSTEQKLATRRATAGSSGTAVDTGTNLKLLLDDARTGGMNAITIANNAARESYGYKVAALGEDQEASLLDYQADLQARGILLSSELGVGNYTAQAASARRAGEIDAGTSIINGFANAGRLFM